MKLLLDANISVKLVDRLAGQYPASTHVSLLGLESTPAALAGSAPNPLYGP